MNHEYNELTLPERCESLIEARREAYEDLERGDVMNPYVAPDPRYYAYRSVVTAEVK